MRLKAEVNLSREQTPLNGTGYTAEEAVAEAMRCLDCPAKYCQRDCPIHTPVPEMCAHIRKGEFSEVYELISSVNELTSMSCRVCPAEKQCQKNCTRSIRGEAVNIPALEQFVNDWHASNSAVKGTEEVARNGKKVAVVGSGPAGLMCAMELLKAGCTVAVYDASERPGGVSRWGIPNFVLPPEITENILKRAEALGAEFISGAALGANLTLEELRHDFDAVFLGIGAPVPVSAGFDAYQAQDLLREASLGRDPVKGRSVAVIGGGDTAIDAVRVARALGSEDVTLIYRRGKTEMPALEADVEAAADEGVKFLWWTEPVDTAEGSITCRKTEAAPADYPGGRANAVAVPGSEFEVKADLTVLALGFKNAPVEGLSCDRQGRILADESGATNIPGVFAAGDAVSGPSTVIYAGAAGKRVAQAILSFLKAQ